MMLEYGEARNDAETRMEARASAARAEALGARFADRTATLCVVGLGYVGLTVACALADAGFRTLGVDIDRSKVDSINRGEYPLHGVEPDLPDLLQGQVRAGRLSASTDFGVCGTADAVLIAVQTPVEASTRLPRLDALREAICSLGPHLRRGSLIVVESTIAPGTMRELVVPWLEQASQLSARDDLFVGCCPERVMPGKLLQNLGTCSRVMGGWTPLAADVGQRLYQTLTRGEVDATDCLTAELVKTTENAYRDVQIAFANEVALLCEEYGADVYAVRALVNKSPFRDMHMPGAGVGGHCIPKDPWLLVGGARAAREAARLIPMARVVNDSMPLHVGAMVERALRDHAIDLAQASILVLGYTYLQDSDDTRNSPSVDLIEWLRERGAHVAVHDPFVPELRLDVAAQARDADCLVLMVAHTRYQHLALDRLAASMRHPILIDGRHLFSREAATTAGFDYRCLGVGG
jgi:UDP-N-acetyl-D-mannosaminuronic acid dehydrogenase